MGSKFLLLSRVFAGKALRTFPDAFRRRGELGQPSPRWSLWPLDCSGVKATLNDAIANQSNAGSLTVIPEMPKALSGIVANAGPWRDPITSFGGARPGHHPQMPHIRQAHDIAAGLRLVHFEPLDVFHDFAKADQQVDLRLSIGLTLQDVERSFDVPFALRYIVGFHLKAPLGCTLEPPFRTLRLPNR
jgi:hypothetical protein